MADKLQYGNDTRVTGYDPLIAPSLLMHELPVSDKGKETIARGRFDVSRVVTGKDDRLLVVAVRDVLGRHAVVDETLHALVDGTHHPFVPDGGADAGLRAADDRGLRAAAGGARDAAAHLPRRPLPVRPRRHHLPEP